MPRGRGPRRSYRKKNLADIFGNLAVPIVLFIFIMVALPLVLGLISIFPNLYVHTMPGGGLTISDSPPNSGATVINLKVIAAIVIFLVSIGLVVFAIDRLSSRI